MAYAFLKGLGVDGEIGKDHRGPEAAARPTGGPPVVAAAGGKVEVESSRYPFCFLGDEKSPDSTRSIVPFVPFNAT